MKPVALYPGSFDPLTKGHEHIVKKAQNDFRVRVGIAVNEGKRGLFSLQERVRIAQKVLTPLNIDPLAVIRISGSVARWAFRSAINTIVRGERDQLDEIGEAQSGYFNNLENPNLVIKLYKSDDNLKYASSSAAKKLIPSSHNPSSIISLHVQEAITSRLLSQYPVFITGGMGSGKTTLARNLEKEARHYGLATRRVELDRVAQEDIYTSLMDPLYVETRIKIAEAFGSEILDSAGFVQSQILREKLQKSPTDTKIDPEKLNKLSTIVSPIIDFRYRDMIEGFQGIIFVDGIVKKGGGFSRHAHNHTLLIDADIEDRVERVGKRYALKGDPRPAEYIRSMIAGQPTRQESESILGSAIEHDNNGSISIVDNSSTGPDIRKTLFKTLNSIDTFGELRAELILKLLNIGGDIKEHINHLQKAYNSPARYHHSWEHIVESLTTLFDMACEMDISDEDLAIIGGAILFHDFAYEVNKDWYNANESISSQEASSYLRRFGVDPRVVAEIVDLILETRHGRVRVSNTFRSGIMYDVDMGILGSKESRYRQYAGGDIPNEFAPMVGNKEYKERRRDKFLIPTLTTLSESKGIFYKTPYGQERFGPNIEKNLRAELEGKIVSYPIDKE